MTLDKVKLKTINNNSIIGDGNITVGGSSVDIVTSWSSTTSDSKVPSEKLTKNSLDGKANSSHTHTKSQITDFPTIPSKTSDLTNDGSSSSDSLVYVETSSTSGLLKNDGTVDTSNYIEASDISFGFDTNTKEIYIEVN